MSRPSATTSKKRKKASCRTLERRARKIKNKRKRRAALKRLPARCRPPKAPPQTPGILPSGTQPAATMVAPPAPGVPGPVPAPPEPGPQAPAPDPAPDPAPSPSPGPTRLTIIDSPIPVYGGTFGPRQAERLLWRAGFGPRPGQAAQVAALDLEQAVLMLTRPPATAAEMDGPEPTVGGAPLDPYGTWGHDHLWWMDRMVRSRHQLVERLALVFHDWFATSNASVGSVKHMMAQTNLFRAHGLGSFTDLVRGITTDPAMLVFLSGIDNRRNAINENYGRELMELFTLGADRGAYTETDVRELARALSGWRADWVDGTGFTNFRWDANRHDAGTKTVFGKSGAWDWEDACRLVLEHELHPSFFVRKLWSYFIPVPPSDAVSAALERRYVHSGRQIRPVLEAILCSPELYEGPTMVKPPVVFAAGLLRARGKGIAHRDWEWMGSGAGQKLYYPPDVSGWDDTRWLDTSTLRGRWDLVNLALAGETLTPTWTAPEGSPLPETPDEAVAHARAHWNDPALSAETVAAMRAWSDSVLGTNANVYRQAQRQNALRMMLGMSPDHHVC